jgi:hypothetical protein
MMFVAWMVRAASLAVAEIPDPLERARVAHILFGKQWPEVLRGAA